MKCTKCGAENVKVVDSKNYGVGIKRMRRCDKCNHEFETFESVSGSDLIYKVLTIANCVDCIRDACVDIEKSLGLDEENRQKLEEKFEV